ncbi:MAG: site-specific integrase [Syntrophomonadaceae bacterium]|nr:site-specific integrase [Syntrophomonadaceae bacterium]
MPERKRGQIVKRGNSYLVRVPLGTGADGERDYHNNTLYTKKDAQAYLAKVQHEVDVGKFVNPSKELLKEHIDKWLKSTVKQRVSAKTLNSYEQIVKRYIVPGLGHIKLHQLTAAKIQSFYADLLEKGLSPRTVRYTHAVLRSALKQSVKFGGIHRNPADLVDLPRQQRKEMRAFTPAQAAEFMRAIVYSSLKTLFSLLLASGMRPSEALGLKWTDINFATGRVTVQRTLIRIRGQKNWRLEEPKTAKSRRVIPLPPTVLADLEEHKIAQSAVKQKAQPGKYNDQNFVFAAANGEPLFDRNVSREFKSILKSVGLPDIRLYDLRHTCATLLLSARENTKVVSERLGHASVVLTLDTYSHVLPDMQDKAAATLEDILFNKPAESSLHTIRTQDKKITGA